MIIAIFILWLAIEIAAVAVNNAPSGYEDDQGFHYDSPPVNSCE